MRLFFRSPILHSLSNTNGREKLFSRDRDAISSKALSTPEYRMYFDPSRKLRILSTIHIKDCLHITSAFCKCTYISYTRKALSILFVSPTRTQRHSKSNYERYEESNTNNIFSWQSICCCPVHYSKHKQLPRNFLRQ